MTEEKEYQDEAKDEGFSDFLYWNKSDLLKEFAGYHKEMRVEDVEEWYPDEFNKFCRDAYKDSKDLEETERSLANDKI